MPKLSAIKKITKGLDVVIGPLDDLPIKVRYYPAKYTPEFEDSLDRMFTSIDIQTIETDIEAMVDGEDLSEEDKVKKKSDVTILKNYVVNLMVELLDSWDITDDDDIPITINVDGVKGVGYVILKQIFRDISVDMSPKEKTSKT